MRTLNTFLHASTTGVGAVIDKSDVADFVADTNANFSEIQQQLNALVVIDEEEV